MGTRQTRLLSPAPAALAGFIGQSVHLILADGEVLPGVLKAVGTDAHVRLSRRGPVRAVAFAAIRELIADCDANR